MKLRTAAPALLIVALSFLSFTSCKPKRDMSKGLKITMQLSLEDAISSSAIDPTNLTLLTSLHQTDQSSPEAFVSSFISNYKKQNPGHSPIEHFIAASDHMATPATDEELKRYFLKVMNTKRSEMADATTRRLSAFLGLKPGDLKFDFHGREMTVWIPGVTNAKDLDTVFSNRYGLRIWATMSIEKLGSYLVRINDTLSSEFKAPAAETKKNDTTSELSLDKLSKGFKADEEKSNGLFEVMVPAINPDGSPTGASYIGIVAIKDTAKVMSLLHKKNVLAILPENIRFMWGELPGKEIGKDKPQALYAIFISSDGLPLISSKDISDAKADEQNGRVEISMTMTPVGTTKWSNATANNVGKALAMEMGEYVYSAPNVNERITGGRSSITGVMTLHEAEMLAKVIKSGGFPLKFEIIKTEPFENKP